MLDDQVNPHIHNDTHTSQKSSTPFTNGKMNHTADRLAILSGSILDHADTIIYAVVGLCFLVGALIALVYSIWEFVIQLQSSFGQSNITLVASYIIQFVSDLLLVLIIMEVLSTVIHYLKQRATSLQPFLFIGIISATRSILSIGARLSIAGTNIQQSEFNRAMIELGVSAAVVLALGITLRLLGKHAGIDSNEV
jgi:uncharacterized membrane protein (DUF373 family)